VNRRKGLRDRWLPHVLSGQTGAGFGCRLMLTVMYFRMTEKGHVSIPRTELAAILGVHPSRIATWTKEAIDAGLLQKVGGGYHGRTAEFTAVIPSPKVTGNRSPSGRKVPVFRSALTGNHLPGQTGREGYRKPVTQYARVTNETRERDDHKRDAGDERNHAVPKERSDGRTPRLVRIADLSPWAQLAYAPLIAGRQRAALEQNHAGSVSPNAGTVPPPVTS
jgi:hypothetical protein